VVRLPLCCLLALWFAGCRSAPPPLRAAAVSPQLTYAPAAVAPPDTRDGGVSGAPLGLAVELSVVREVPDWPDLAAAAEVITADTPAPFRGAVRQLVGARWTTFAAAGLPVARASDPAGERLLLGTTTGVLAAGLRTTLAIDSTQAQLHGERRPGLVLWSVRAPGSDRETVQLPALPDATTAGALFLPAPPTAAYAGHVLAWHTTDLVDATALAAATSAATPPVPAPGLRPAWQLAGHSVGANNRRPALLALAQQFALPGCADLLLAADELALIAIGDALHGLAVAMLPAGSPNGWQFEATLLRALLPGLERDELAPGLHAALRRQLGAVAKDATTLRELLEHGDAGTFAAALREDNVAALDDPSVALRCAAHDWLRQHGGAVPDYDPLAQAATRRAALRVHAANTAAAAAAPEVDR
jgi:hypothetical protein